ncbi:hypothetical protein [Microbacterium paraoxydans]|uniref:hypothetical protein n=1 Tax=Microbacterium paraoxydans TaxID=199592 RepID=UPI001C2BEA1E|nr:hypothetical protein [Microbacterium paraoxydans]QXE28561.1 hypothetical protein IZR02_09050 [Microbacterium paraoxydans]
MSATPTLADLRSEANWLEWRSKIEHLGAIRLDDLVTTEQSRGEFITGARLLRLDERQRAGDGGKGPSPMQLMVADLLAAGRFMNAIFEPRRSTKTTGVQAVMLGRCWHREDYQVGWTMFTTGAKAGERFRKDIVSHLDRLYPSRRDSPVQINVGKGTEHLHFTATGSYLNVYTPNGEGFRSGGFDMAFGDEAAEADIEQGEDVTRAVIPTMDTKIGAQFVLAGTGQKWRTGNLLWEALHDEDAAVAWHGIPETVDRAQLGSWEPDQPHPKTGATGGRMREFIELHHPGVGFTTPVEAVRRSFDRWPLDDFLIEYGGQFGTEGAADVAIPPAQLDRALRKLPFPEALPERYAAALKVHHLGLGGSLAIAWDYHEPGDLVTEALEIAGEEEPRRKRAVALWWHQQGTTNLEREVLLRLRRTGAKLWYDAFGYTEQVAGALAKASPRPVMEGTRQADIPKSTVGMLKALEDDDLVIYYHPALERAARAVKRQKFGNYGTFRFGPPDSDPELDTSPIEAAALALRFLDEVPHTKSPRDMFRFGGTR